MNYELWERVTYSYLWLLVVTNSYLEEAEL